MTTGSSSWEEERSQQSHHNSRESGKPVWGRGLPEFPGGVTWLVLLCCLSLLPKPSTHSETRFPCCKDGCERAILKGLARISENLSFLPRHPPNSLNCTSKATEKSSVQTFHYRRYRCPEGETTHPTSESPGQSQLNPNLATCHLAAVNEMTSHRAHLASSQRFNPGSWSPTGIEELVPRSLTF